MSKNYATRPLWFWNDLPTEEGIIEVIENCVKKDGYVGFGILPYNACKLEYMGEEYLRLYGIVLREAKRLGIKICLYDEWWFPSGSAGGILKRKYPEACAKRLDMEEYAGQGQAFCIELPQDGKIMAVVGMRGTTRVDLADFVQNGILTWTAPEEDYTVLCFVLRDSGFGRVDYLDPESVKKFIACTHEVYYEHFTEYFGDVIDGAFYDEPQFYSLKGRQWTAAFNDRYQEKYGESPALYYPALFYDIGEETAMARNRMFGLRAELYAKGFPKTIQDWCTVHGITLTGHVDQEEVDNPCGITGDLMLSFKYQDIPGIDEIFKEGRASEAYKVVSSAAVNWNKKLVMCECFGAMEDITEEAIYRESYDLFTKGVNMLIPHAVWYNASEEKVKFKPELSYRHDYYGKLLPEYNKYCAEVQSRLQNGGQVNSIAVLYPIESLQYMYTLNWEGTPQLGGPTSEKNNYLRLGQGLSRELNCDYTFLYPEVLQNNCQVEDGVLSIKDSIHYQNFRVLILPGMKAMSLKTAEKLKEFVVSGGTLIAVSELPSVSLERGESTKLWEIMIELFGIANIGMSIRKKSHGKGKCYAMPYAQCQQISEILEPLKLDTKVKQKTPGLQYIHKRMEAKDVWYFTAILEDVDTEVILDGKYELTILEPRLGEGKTVPVEYGDEVTKCRLVLEKGQSALIEGIKL